MDQQIDFIGRAVRWVLIVCIINTALSAQQHTREGNITVAYNRAYDKFPVYPDEQRYFRNSKQFLDMIDLCHCTVILVQQENESQSELIKRYGTVNQSIRMCILFRKRVQAAPLMMIRPNACYFGGTFDGHMNTAGVEVP